MIFVPIAAAIGLTTAGTFLFYISGPSKSLSVSTVFFGKVLIGLAALGGLVLTAYFHANSLEDQRGMAILHNLAERLLLFLPVAALIGLASRWSRKL